MLQHRENDCAVELLGLDGRSIAIAQIPENRVGIILTLDGRAFQYQSLQKCYVEVPTVILGLTEHPPMGAIVH